MSSGLLDIKASKGMFFITGLLDIMILLDSDIKSLDIEACSSNYLIYGNIFEKCDFVSFKK